MQLTNLQKETVEKLLGLYNPNTKTKIDFKAPTGSGKTLMATCFISELIAQNPNDKFVFVIATPSSSDLPFSFEQKILQYKQDLTFSDFSVEYVKSPSEFGQNRLKTDGTIKIIPEQNKIFIFGKSSFGKDRILTTRHIIDDFVSTVIDQNFKLIYIRDEAHIGGNIVNDQNFESLMQNNATLIIKMTATPNYKDLTINKVVLTEEDLNNPVKNDGKFLLKTQAVTLLKNTMTDEDMLLDAIKNFKLIKEEYRKLEDENVYIRPAMLIQVRNDTKIDIEESVLFNEALENIKKQLENNGLSWAKYFGNNDKESNTLYKDKFTLYQLTGNMSDIDAIIFKIGPATGWDIPRACMLLQLRKVSSEGLNIQTIGRIKRNCYPNLVKNEITDKYYIYSNAPQDKNLFVFTAEVKKEFVDEPFMSVEITNIKDCSKKVSEQRLKEDLLRYLTNNKNKIFQYSKELFQVDETNNIYYKDIHLTITGGQYISKISNVFQFIKFYKDIKLSNNYIFDFCEQTFNEFWKTNFISSRIDNFQYTKEMFYITLIKYFKNDIVNLINKNKQYKPKYKVVSSPYKPETYTEIYSSMPHDESTRIHSYLFNTKLNGIEYIQALGENSSSPEVIVFDKISNIDYDKGNIRVWCKNFTTSNVNGAYLDKYNNLRHSFFDFIVKFKNNVLLYIEVKGEKDINPEKTNMLKGAYQEYFNKSNITIFDKPIVFSIFKVNTEKRIINHESFYDKSIFQKDLNSLSLDELIDEISSLKTYHV